MLNLPDKNVPAPNCRIFPKNATFHIYKWIDNCLSMYELIDSWNLYRQLVVLDGPPPPNGYLRTLVATKEPTYNSHNTLVRVDDFYIDPGWVAVIGNMAANFSIGDEIELYDEKWIITSNITEHWCIRIHSFVKNETKFIQAESLISYPAPIDIKSPFLKDCNV